MHGIILAAGRGSRLGKLTENRPKPLVEVDGRQIFHHQMSVLDSFCSGVTVAIGHGFDSKHDHKVDDAFEPDSYDAEMNFVYVDEWAEKENASSLLQALRNLEIDEHVVVLCGDVLFTADLFEDFIGKFKKKCTKENYNSVAYIPGVQDEMTAITLDGENVDDYGKIKGHQEAGLFIINSAHIKDAASILGENQSEWFPVMFPRLPTKGIEVNGDEHIEINTPGHYREAKLWAKDNLSKTEK